MTRAEIAKDVCAIVCIRFIKERRPTKRKELLLRFKDSRSDALDTLADLLRVGFLYDDNHKQVYSPRAAALELASNEELLRFVKSGFSIAFKTLAKIYESDAEDRAISFAEAIREARQIFTDVDEEAFRWGLYFCKEFNLFHSYLPGDQIDVDQFTVSESIISIASPEEIWERETERYSLQPMAASPAQLGWSLENKPQIESEVGTVPTAANPFKSQLFFTAFHAYTKTGDQLGAGGAGVVLAVKDEDGAPFALKLLAQQTGSTKSKRFQNEIAFCMGNKHANIIRVLDYGIADAGQRPFYVMPLYGSTLRTLLNGDIKPEDVLALYAQILAGVDAAHQLGVCHRDLKPENMLYDADRSMLVVADFGIAQFREEDLYTAVETSNQERLANFVYSAPEQRIRGREVTQRADIYALGLILNEMFTGEVPQGSGFKCISEVAPQFAYLDPIVDSMLQQQPQQRPASVAEIQTQLIARGNEFIDLQKLDTLKSQVVPTTTIEDALISKSVTVTGVDYRGGTLTITLDQSPNPEWIRSFRTPSRSFNLYSGQIEPTLFAFGGSSVSIRVEESLAQKAIDLFKEYASIATPAYTRFIESRQRAAEQAQRESLKKQVQEEERRQALLRNLKI